MEEKREKGRKDGGDRKGDNNQFCDASTPGGLDVSHCIRPWSGWLSKRY